MTAISGSNTTSQALCRNYASLQKTASNIAQKSSTSEMPDTNDLVDLTQERMQAKVLTKTLSVQNKCEDHLLDILA